MKDLRLCPLIVDLFLTGIRGYFQEPDFKIPKDEYPINLRKAISHLNDLYCSGIAVVGRLEIYSC